MRNKPALVMMQVLSYGQAFDPNSTSWREYTATSEDLLGALAQYYDAQWLSLRNVAWSPAVLDPSPGLSWKDIMCSDRIHPGTTGPLIP